MKKLIRLTAACLAMVMVFMVLPAVALADGVESASSLREFAEDEFLNKIFSIEEIVIDGEIVGLSLKRASGDLMKQHVFNMFRHLEEYGELDTFASPRSFIRSYYHTFRNTSLAITLRNPTTEELAFHSLTMLIANGITISEQHGPHWHFGRVYPIEVLMSGSTSQMTLTPVYGGWIDVFDMIVMR
ncbi:MAG: hypothetical protein FWE33_06360 [Defluviitaleaceae bacterium]|nr:hypothetical protein [Defluviitaleaceae bacterium]